MGCVPKKVRVLFALVWVAAGFRGGADVGCRGEGAGRNPALGAD